MTRSAATSLPDAENGEQLISKTGWVWIGILTALFALVHRNFFYRTWLFATGDPNWSHALLVPAISIYFIYQHRDRLAATPKQVSFWGLPILFFGLFGYAMGIYPVRNDMAQGYSTIIALFGLVLFLLGPRMMRVLWFPIAYLVFAVKVSDRLWSQVAWQLQQIAAQGAAAALKCCAVFLDFDVANRGSTIDLTFMRGGELITEGLNVAEACSGLRMLMAFLALATAVAFLRDRAWWQRLVVVVMAVPIAVAVNIGRVTVLGLLHLVKPELAQGEVHTFVGMLMLIPAGILFLLLGWVLDKIVIVDESAEQKATGGPSQQTPAQASATTQTLKTQPKTMVAGLAMGAMLMLLIGIAYGLLLSLVRPDLLLEGLSPMFAGAVLAGVVVVAAIAAGWLLPKTLRGSGRQVAAASLVAGVLLTATVGQGVVIAATQAVLIKEAVPLRHKLWKLPAEAGPWKLFRDDPPLSAEVLQALKTEQYLSRLYEDTSWPEDKPGRLVRLHIAYYTDTPDTVPHVPDRCFVAGGAQGMGTSTATLALTGPGYEGQPAGDQFFHKATLEPEARMLGREIDATVFTYADPKRPRHTEHVLYFFVANGQVLSTPDLVRAQGFDPRDRYSFYCKVEIQVFGVSDKAVAQERAASLLSHMMPDVMACLPDWVDVRAGLWPKSDAKATE